MPAVRKHLICCEQRCHAIHLDVLVAVQLEGLDNAVVVWQSMTCYLVPSENMSDAGESGGGADAPLLAMSSGAT